MIRIFKVKVEFAFPFTKDCYLGYSIEGYGSYDVYSAYIDYA